MVSGNYQSSICIVVDAGLTTPRMDAPDNYQTTYMYDSTDSNTKIVVFYSLSICTARRGQVIFQCVSRFELERLRSTLAPYVDQSNGENEKGYPDKIRTRTIFV